MKQAFIETFQANSNQFHNENYFIVKQTWLTRKPHPDSFLVALLCTFIIVVFSTLDWLNVLGVSSWVFASYEKVFRDYEFWRLWTTLFVHADWGHLLSNMTWFMVFGFFLTGYFGLIVFPFVAIVFGGLINALVLVLLPLSTHLIGSSGVVFWMGGAWISLYFHLDRQRTVFKRLLRSIGVLVFFFMPEGVFDPQISYSSHFVGLFFGLLFGSIYFRMNKNHFRAAEVLEFEVHEVEVTGPNKGPSDKAISQTIKNSAEDYSN